MGILSAISVETKLAAIACCILYVVLKRWLAHRGSDIDRVRKVPGGHWLWGHEYEAWSATDGKFYIENGKDLGQAFVLKAGLFHDDLLAITDPAALSHIYTKHPYDYVHSDVLRPLIERLLGRSLVWAEGETHKRQRQMLAPAFTHENVKRMGDEIHNASESLVDLLRDHIHKGTDDAKAGVSVNILNWTCRATLQIIGRVGFGHDFQCGNCPEADAIQASWHQLVQMGLEFPGFAAPLVLRAFPFITGLPIPAIQAQGEIKTIIKKLALEIVNNRKAMGGDASTKGGKDLLSILMRMSETQGEDIDQILDHICTFVMVGHETSSATINFSLLELARNKDVQDRLRRELLEFNGSGPGGEPTYEEYQSKLPYLDAVCKESLRMYPPASHTERVATKDDVLPLRFPITSRTGEEITSIRVKAGQLIYVPIIAINRNIQIWGPDAETFRPERWLTTDQLPPPTSLTQGWSGIFSFIEGPRICIGYRLALFEFKVIVASLVKNFEFSATDDKIVTQFSSTLQPYIEGNKAAGAQIPLIVKELHH